MVLSNKEWLDKMNEIISAIQNGGCDSQVIEDMLSNMWISSVTYNVGDYVLYNNNIWKCLVQNSNIAPSEGTTWTRVNITSEISTLNSNLANHINCFSNVNVNGTISYMQIGKLVIVRLINHPISKTFTLGVPAGSSSIVVSLRDEANGKLARFWFDGEGIDVYRAENYTSGNGYSGQFCYISM